ncbi:MAG: response regulator [Syntrophobacteraceae bacterium]
MECVRRILVVDDEPHYPNALIRHLKREGFFADLAHDDQAATIKIEEAFSKKVPFDVIVMNTLIHSSNGIDLLAWVHQQHPGVSVILVSAYGHSDETIGRIRPDMDDYGKKPLMPQGMMELIGSVERKRKCAEVRMRKRIDNLKAGLPEDPSVSVDT